MKAIVTDTNLRQSLCVVRSLGGKGIDVTCVTDTDAALESNMGAYSKYCKEQAILPSMAKEPEFFLSELLDLCKRHDVLIPMSTETIEFICNHLDIFTPYIRIPIPDFNTIYRARNKEILLRLAYENEVPIPKTYFVKDLKDVEQVAAAIRYPAIIKIKDEKGIDSARRHAFVYSGEELKAKYLQIHSTVQEYPLIQEKIEGEGMGFFALFGKNSQPKAIFCHKRIREFPVTGGPSTFCVGIRDEKIIKHGIRLLQALNWYGVAMVEFKMDKLDSEPKLMEVNPRFWGSLALAVASGVDFPYLLFRLALGEDIQPAMTYKEGVKVRFFVNDLRATMQYLCTPQPLKINFLGRFIRDLFDMHIHDGIISIRDFKPALHHSIWMFKRVAGGLRSGHSNGI